jgi:nucleotide-binding universal stress UspA family protein
MLKKILAPTDLSDISANGVRYACQLAKEVGAELIIFNVVVLDESNAIDKREMERNKGCLEEFVTQTIADAGTGLEVRQIVNAGQAFGAIVDCAEREGVDVIVMSSHGRSGLSRMLIGSLHHFCMTELFMGEPKSGFTHRDFAEQVVDVLLASGVVPGAPALEPVTEG